jgi:putative sulfotransferase
MADTQRCVILNIGRCGSTLLSDLIAAEPETLSVQESLMTLMSLRWDASMYDELAGSQYWDIMRTPSLQWQVCVRIGAITGEYRYPATGRWADNLAALPPILAVTLPAISDDPDTLFDFLDARVPHFPVQPLAQHHQMLLDLLASLYGRRRWVERTGASSRMAVWLLKEFPADKVVYLSRNMGDAARSMSRHFDFQLAAIQVELLGWGGFNPYSSRTPSVGAHGPGQRLPAQMRCLLPDQLTREALAEWGGKLSRHELMCAELIRCAEWALAAHPPRHLLRMQYEDLVVKPVEELTRLGEFLGFADPTEWAVGTAGRVSNLRGNSGMLASSGATAAPYAEPTP